MAVIADMTGRWLRQRSEREVYAVGAAHRSLPVSDGTDVYAVGGAFRLPTVPDGDDIAKVDWQIDAIDYVVTAAHPMQALEQVFEHHSHYSRGWVFNDKGQRVVFICPLVDFRNYTPGAAEPQEATCSGVHIHLIGY